MSRLTVLPSASLLILLAVSFCVAAPEKPGVTSEGNYDRDTFTYDTIGENAVGRSSVTFTIGPDGHATQVVVENLNAHREGTFKRVKETRSRGLHPQFSGSTVILSEVKDLWNQ